MDAKIRGIEEKAAEILERLGRISNGTDGNQNVTHVVFGGGGLALWASVTAAVVCFVLVVMMAIMVMNMDRRVSQMQDYLNVIYQQAPWLKPDQSPQKE